MAKVRATVNQPQKETASSCFVASEREQITKEGWIFFFLIKNCTLCLFFSQTYSAIEQGVPILDEVSTYFFTNFMYTRDHMKNH